MHKKKNTQLPLISLVLGLHVLPDCIKVVSHVHMYIYLAPWLTKEQLS